MRLRLRFRLGIGVRVAPLMRMPSSRAGPCTAPRLYHPMPVPPCAAQAGTWSWSRSRGARTSPPPTSAVRVRYPSATSRPSCCARTPSSPSSHRWGGAGRYGAVQGGTGGRRGGTAGAAGQGGASGLCTGPVWPAPLGPPPFPGMPLRVVASVRPCPSFPHSLPSPHSPSLALRRTLASRSCVT